MVKKKKISNPTSIVKFQCKIEFGDNLRRVRDVTKMWAPLGCFVGIGDQSQVS